MAQATDEAGNIWEVDAQGNAVRLIRAAGAAPQMPADPTFPYQGPKAAADATRAQADATVASATTEAQIRKANAEAAAAQAKANEAIANANAGGGLTPGRKKADETFAVDYAAWTAGGGFAGLENKLSVLSDALDILESSDTITGPIFGRLPKFLQQMVDPRSQDVRADVEKAIQETLRQTLGAQFTAKEGESILARTFDPTQQEASNARRARNLIKELRTQGVAKDSAARFFEQNGTISGWTAPRAAETPENDRRTPPALEQPGFASGGAAEKSIPIPQPMQDEHAAYLAQNWGRLDQNAYAEFRASLDSKYGFEPRPDAYRAIVPDLNDRAAQGGSPDGLNIPPVNAKMDGLDQINASVFNNKAGGFIFGAGDQLGVADELAGGFNSLVKGTDYDVEVARANAMKQGMQDAYPGMNLTGNIVGVLATGAGAAKAFPGLSSALTGSTKRAIGTGAAFGGASGAGEMNDDRLTGLAIGTGLGVAGGGAGAAASPIIRSAMGTQAGQAVSRAGRSAWNNTAGKITPSMQVAAAPVVPQFRKGEGLLPAEVLESAIPNLQDADRLGLPYALADADPQLRALAGSVSRRSADARQMAENTFGPRAGDQVERATTAIETHLAPPVDIGARQQEWRRVANERARPLYEEAYQGGSTAPLENQLESAFNASSRGVSEARAALQAAERGATVSSAQVSRAGNNVYQNAQALPGERNANAAIEGARQRLAQAEAQHTQVVEQLRRSQGDAASNAPGAVWNPRLQEFIDDPLSKAGLARGLEIQRLEALAEGRPFDPTEYAVVGNDAAGNPVVGNVPNLRTLDAIKKGYDAILDDYPRDMKGNQIFDQRGRAITMAKKSLVGELDGVTGGELGPYASARNTYGTYTQLGQRLQEGYDAAPRGTYARDIQPRLGAMDDANRGEFQSGYATRLRDMVQDTNDSADPYRLIYGGSERRAKMATVFPEGHQQFGRVYDLEQDMSKTAYETMGGSPTAMRQATDQQFDSGMMGIGTDLAADAAGGGGAFTLKSMIGRGARALGDTARIRGGKAKADAIAPVLYAPDPRMTLDYLADLQARQAQAASRAGAYRRRGGLFGAILPSAFLGSE